MHYYTTCCVYALLHYMQEEYLPVAGSIYEEIKEHYGIDDKFDGGLLYTRNELVS